jgi:hypothetical protein
MAKVRTIIENFAAIPLFLNNENKLVMLPNKPQPIRFIAKNDVQARCERESRRPAS